MSFNSKSAVSGRLAWANFLVLMVACAFISGCATGGLPRDESLVLASVSSSEELNPDINQRPSPVELHIYFLKSSAVFLNQDYYSLMENPEQVLRQDLVSRGSMIITPGRMEHKAFKVDGEYDYIGIVVSFRNLDGSQWRAIASKPEKSLVSAIWPEHWRIGKPKRSLYLSVNESEVIVPGQIK